MKVLKKAWCAFNRPAKFLSIGLVTTIAFAAGIGFVVSFNSALEWTNTEEFCISCHSMESKPYQELQETVHWSNHSGVRATCPDCHVPQEWSRKIARKMEASNDVLGWLIGSVDTDEKFEEKRLEMASREWKRFERDASLACKGCHDYAQMDFDSMSALAQKQMKRAAERDQSCVDCHKGIAHKLPDMGTARAPELVAEVGEGPSSLAVGQELYAVLTKDLYLTASSEESAGMLNVATKVRVLETSGSRAKIAIDGWRKRIGLGRVVYFDFGVNMLSAQLAKSVVKENGVMTVFEEKEDDMTGLKWQRLEVQLWTDTKYLTTEVQPLWDYAKTTYDTSCSVCHTQPDEAHFDANTWPGMFQGMAAFVNMDADTSALIQKYLQAHSSTYNTAHHNAAEETNH